MILHLINIHIPYVFKRYVKKYNIYRDLYEIDLIALEIRGIKKELAEHARLIILRNKEICYLNDNHNNQKDLVDLLILGSFGIFKDIANDIVAVGNEDLGYRMNRLLEYCSTRSGYSLMVRDKEISRDRALIMGILNITPDSFSDGGKYYDKETAVNHGLKLIEHGSDILDVGGESTRPGAKEISADEEIDRVVPVISQIKKAEPEAVVSIDTRKYEVAQAAVEAGADIVNDISSFDYDERIADFCAEKNLPLILMHMKGSPETMQENPYYEDVVNEIYSYLSDKVKTAEKKGVKKIVVDPGFGFGKNLSDNYEILERLNELRGLGKPLLAGISKKSLIGKALNLPINEREEATLCAETLAIQNGADIIRTHNVQNALKAAEICKFFNNPGLLLND